MRRLGPCYGSGSACILSAPFARASTSECCSSSLASCSMSFILVIFSYGIPAVSGLRAPRLEINDNGSVSEAFAPAPVVDRNGAQRFDFTLFPDMALQLPQDGVVADSHSQARQQPFADPTAGGMGEQSNEFANSLCFPRGRQRDRQRFGECLSNTLLVATSPAA